MKKRGLFLFLLAAITGIFVACGMSATPVVVEDVEAVFYLNKEDTKIVQSEYEFIQTDKEKLLDELILMLQSQPEDLSLRPPISKSIGLVAYRIEETQIILEFSDDYKTMESAREVLTRAAIVKTLTQIEGIEYISFYVGKDPLTDATGSTVGPMKGDIFIDNSGAQINAYEKVKLHLYLANEQGDGLIEVSRSIVYNSNISLEKLVVEQLIQGPMSEESYAAINPTTKIISVSVKDGVCYVNLNEDFLAPVGNATSDVTIYSITNSLVELSNINKVQILIDGNTDIMFRETVSLSTIFERNLELLTTD